jgi:hypothetical protein
MTYQSLGLSISIPAAYVFALSVPLRAHRATPEKRAEAGGAAGLSEGRPIRAVS